ncbi:hypothetical protein [Stenotrophomonas sp. 364]|uniref:hypothetical protein n=1 Tax=Stenotrophomonas sp. 364 TaxID=2691571 RepID=UPI001319134F|nr:hypothetical protein [Stenotrophomonas sp. 364]QHB70630.1 hypothetical protein GQ674_04535 [Stenotrophomonas sp. 364]
MSILNVLLRADQLLVAVDTWAEDAPTQKPSVGAKLLLIPQHNLANLPLASSLGLRSRRGKPSLPGETLFSSFFP